MEFHEELGRPWPGLTDRLERAVEAVENLRDLLLGTFDIHMGRAAQDANDVMKVLTLLSAVLLPAVVLAGVMGMNFKLPFFDEPGNFWIVVAAMVVFAVAIVIARLAGGWLVTVRSTGYPRAPPGQSRTRLRRPRRGTAQIRPPIAATSRAQTNNPIPAPPADVGGARRAIEQLEQPVGLVGREARAVVQDADDDLGSPRPVLAVPHARLGDDRHGRPPAAVLGGIRQEVAHDLLDVGRIGDDRRQPRRHVGGERDAGPAALLRMPRPAGSGAGAGPAPRRSRRPRRRSG